MARRTKNQNAAAETAAAPAETAAPAEFGAPVLREVAKELNAVLGLDPAIKVVGVTKDKLLADITEAAKLLEEGDATPAKDENGNDLPVIGEQTVTVLNGLGIGPWTGAPTAAPAAAAPAAPAKGKGKKAAAPAAAPAAPAADAGEGKKKAVKKGASEYGTAIALMCKTPDLEFADLQKGMAKAGFAAVGSATRTAHSTVRSIVRQLRENGLMG